MSQDPKCVYLIQMNHFDPIWRRCWDRRFEHAGKLYASYADVEQAIMDDWLATAQQGQTTFVLEQAVSLRKYLERRPEQLETLRSLARQGRFELLAAGEVIPDANMPLGESLVRNLLYGLLWAEKTLGIPVTTGCRTDGFGSSAQIPQIFRQCEIRWLPFLHYRAPDNDYWRGLDGTTLCVRAPQPQVFNGSNVKLRPCEACGGQGCERCLGRGFDQSGRVTVEHWLDDLGNAEFGLMLLGGEEALPCKDLEARVAERAPSAAGVVYRYGTYQDIAARFAADIEAVDNPSPERISRESDLALSSSGCWVTRIKLKQRNRRAEHHLLAAETLASLAWLRAGSYPTDPLEQAWRTLVFTHFHDALTATHVDPAYDELMDMYDRVDSAAGQIATQAATAITQPGAPRGDTREVAIFNTLSWPRSAPVTIVLQNWPTPWATASDDQGELPVYDLATDAAGRTTISTLGRDVPAMGGKTIRLTPCPDQPAPQELPDNTIENDCFCITANQHGITSIVDRHTGQELIDYAHYYAGELILERDYGDPWATRSPDRRRERMSPFGRRVAMQRTPAASRIIFQGQHPGNFHDFEVNWLTWRQRVVLPHGLPYVEFVTEVDWDTHNRRLRLAIPTTVRSDTGDYEIPYGTLRRRRHDDCSYQPNGVNGDWPTIHWAAPASPDGSVAVINRGEGSYRIEGGNVLVSLLRSPTTPWCLYEPQFYRMPLFDGMRDAGVHSFRLALYPFRGPWSQSDVTRQAWSYNAPLLALADRTANSLTSLSLSATGTMISTLKRAKTGEALMVRLYEYAGRGETVELTLPQGFSQAAAVNLLERQASPIPVVDRAIRVALAPFKLVTLRLER